MNEFTVRRAIRDGLFTVLIRTEGCDLPEEYLAFPRLRLNYSKNFDPGDIRIEDGTLVSTLSFKGNWYVCRVPLENILELEQTGNHQRG